MNGNAYSNMIKSIIVFLIELLAIIIILYYFAFFMSAGYKNYQLSTIFVILEALIIIIAYICWYIKVNKVAVEMFNIEKMRIMAFGLIPKYWFISLALSVVVALVGLIMMGVGLLFNNVIFTYRIVAVIAELVVGNITLLLMMLLWGIPDRVLARV